MGLIRGALFILLTIVLFLSLLFMGARLTVSMSLDYDYVKPEIKNVVNGLVLDQVGSSEIETLVERMQFYCNTTNSTVLNQDFQGQTLEIPCDVAYQGSDVVINYIVDDLVEENYYKDYNCEFTDCFGLEEQPFFLFSKHTKDYFHGWFYIGLVLSILLAIGLFLLSESKTSYPFIVGGILLVASLPFLLVGKLISFFVGIEYTQIFGLFFSQAYTLFIVFIILAVVSFCIGVLLKFISVGSFI